MVATRRKPIIVYKEASDSEYNVEDPATWEPGRTKKEPNAKEDEEYEKPKRKRQRPSASPLKGKWKGKMTARKLMRSFFDALPLELVFEIFSHLRPIDLLQLARTTKLLRSYLMQKSSSFVWKAARKNESPSPPDCPADQSEPQWAHLIYTRDFTICGQPRIQKVDWSLRVRGCERCLKINIYTRIRAVKAFPEIEDVDAVLGLLPYTNTGGWAHVHASNSKFYLKDSIVKIAVVIGEYQAEVDAGVEGAQRRFETFIAQKKKEAAAVVASAPGFKKWAADARAMRKHLDGHMKELRLSMMKARLLELGHLEADIDVAKSRARILDSATELTEARWNAIRSKAEETVNDAKARRIELLRVALIARKGETKGLLPDAIHLASVPLVSDLVTKDGEDPLATDNLMPLLPDVISQWVEEVKMNLLKNVMKEDGPSVSELPTASGFDSLSLAVSTFSCKSSSCRPQNEVVFIDGKIREHHCWTPWRHHCLNFDSWKSEVAAELVSLSDLHPASATQEDMDKANTRFLCGVCIEDASEVVRNWRKCLEHISDHTYGPHPIWIKLDEEATQSIHDIEDATQDTSTEAAGSSS